VCALAVSVDAHNSSSSSACERCGALLRRQSQAAVPECSTSTSTDCVLYTVAVTGVEVGSSGVLSMRAHACALLSRRVSQSISSMPRAVRAKQLEFVYAE
jgi:hypothetical protein